MKKAVKINNVIGVVEEVGELTYSVRVEDDNYYYLDVIVQAQGDELIAINNGSALASTINNTLGFFLFRYMPLFALRAIYSQVKHFYIYLY